MKLTFSMYFWKYSEELLAVNSNLTILFLNISQEFSKISFSKYYMQKTLPSKAPLSSTD